MNTKPAEGNATYSKLDAVFTQRRVETSCAQLIPYFKPGQQILDVGCGHGSITIDMASNYVPDGTFKALDLNSEWLEAARAEADRQGVKNIEWMTGDAGDLSRFDDDSFDIVHAHQLLLHLKQPVKALQEMRRVCKPGGIVTARDCAWLLWLPETSALERCKEVAMAASARQGVAAPWGGKHSHAWAHDAGFPWEHIHMDTAGWELSGRDGRAMWAAGSGGIINAAVTAGLASEDDRRQFEQAWAEWSKNPAARVMGTDGVVVCWK